MKPERARLEARPHGAAEIAWLYGTMALLVALDGILAWIVGLV